MYIKKKKSVSGRICWHKAIGYIVMLLLLLSSCNVKDNVKIEVYVAIDGSDANKGSLENPFNTVYKALDTVRELRQLGNETPAVIYLRAGRHQLHKTIVLGIEDGLAQTEQEIPDEAGAGQIRTPLLTFASYPGEEAILSSGVTISGWELLEERVEDLPENAVGKVWVTDMPNDLKKFNTLYDQKGRLKRAISKGFVPVKNGDKRTLYFPEGVLKNWENLSDVELKIRPNRAWMINMLPLEWVDDTNNVAKTSVTATYDLGKLPGWVHTEDGTQAWVENILGALDEPGEWVVNTVTGKLYLWPLNPASDGSPQGILAPTMSELVRVEGKIDYDGSADKAVQGIKFANLTFTHADRFAWTNDKNRVGWGVQHDWDLFDRPTAMLRLRGAENCQIIDCNFINSGGSAIRLDLHAQRNRIENCEMANLGEAGILLIGYGPGTKDVNHHNEVINNHIHHFSEITWHSPGIWAWQSGYNRIANNEVHHAGYSGILVTTRVTPNRDLNGEGGKTVRHHEINPEDKEGVIRTYENWLVREKYNHSRHNLVEYNDISHTVQLLSDGNAIYVSGTGKGNILRYNYIHDNLKHSFPSAIRCDDDQHETLIHGNILYNNYGFSAGIASKGINDITNNFIVAPITAPKWGYISLEWYQVTGSKIKKNIIVSHSNGGNPQAQRPRGPNRPGPIGFHPELISTDNDSNLYFHPTDPNWVTTYLENMRAAGLEKGSLFGNPLFKDYNNEDFRFKKGSPAFKLGIEELDVSKMGRLNKGQYVETN
nr:right-handed parallel beta-helix repeat-containing protein [uncultured Allomuricauda sp.]